MDLPRAGRAAVGDAGAWVRARHGACGPPARLLTVAASQSRGALCGACAVLPPLQTMLPCMEVSRVSPAFPFLLVFSGEGRNCSL